ncbi:MAG: sulfate adenylyltransferase [Acidiferrobacteraceae bacterium]|nr:sulfate adenylyltransferase [Acidiferrobacteraceae bacterium]|tara:strand:- start:190 stop:1374 length:1185 start_codon:yes stop_codon:yes gene_type:complete
MIRPHGTILIDSLYVEDSRVRADRLEEAKTLPKLLINSSAAANLVMLGAGYFSPLKGFMDKADAISVAKELHTRQGLFWPIPILNLVQDATDLQHGDRIALCDPNIKHNPVIAIQDITTVETLTEDELSEIVQNIYRTSDSDHPGVETLLSLGRMIVAGPVEVLSYSYFETDFPDTFRTARQIREQIEANDWSKVVAFQTRNPMHRAHEELCKMALDSLSADGLLIHMLLGKLKPGDIPADVRDAAIRKMVADYFPNDTVMVAGYGFDMLYAGPREAILHAIFRQNAGCTHLIVGRDHAGVGGYYGPFDAQTIFDDEVPSGALNIEIFRADHTAYSKKLQKVVMMRDAPDHNIDDFVILSGTRVREMLSSGKPLPPEFARPEVAEILMRYYKGV